MEQTLTAWLVPAITLLVGIAIGFLIARLVPGAAPNKTQRQLDDTQERFDNYQSEVASHFNTTANLVKKLSQSYQDVQDHLSDGADRLALDELTRQRLLAALDDTPTPYRAKLTPLYSSEPPKDYAPKGMDAPGTLDANFGLKK